MEIELSGLTVSYQERGQDLVYTGGLSLGEQGFSVIQGASGCGKTTLFHCLAGILETSNQSEIWGEILGLERVKVALMFQELRLFGTRSVAQHLRDVGVREQEEVERWLDFVGLGQEGALYPSSLSGGMGRRLSFARVLAYGTLSSVGLYLLDEPFTGVDEERIQVFLDYLWGLSVPVLIATHQPMVVARATGVYTLSTQQGGEILVKKSKI